MEKKKDNLFFVIATIILSAIVIALVLYICYEKGFIFKESNKEEIVDKDEEQKSKEKEEIREVEITDTVLQDDLSAKIDYITNFPSGYNTTINYGFRNNEEIYGDVFNNLNEDTKLHIVLTYLNRNNQFASLSERGKNSPVISSFPIYEGIEIKEISGEVVNREYKRFFGSTPTNVNSTIGKACFAFYYDEAIDTYFWITPTCGGSSASYIAAFKNKYVTYGDLAYVYVNYALLQPVDMSVADNYNIYKDFDKSSIYQSNVAASAIDNFKIDASNYQNFSEYRFAFKKDGSNYYFTKIERIR